jgi:multicomponent Na+:H+ antiporter subunit G
LVRELLTAFGVVVGVAFMFVASVGLVRFPDFYLRVHAPTKAATLGLFALVGALLAAVPEVREAPALLTALFIGATIPVSAHILTRGAYRSGLRPSGTNQDEYAPVAQAPVEEDPDARDEREE